MITKDDKIMCDSCSKQIVGEPYVVNDKREGWVVASHFHPTALECSTAVERITITMRRRYTQKDREQTWQNT
jgi:hypothetical protein